MDILVNHPTLKNILDFLTLLMITSAYYSLLRDSRKILALLVAPIESLSDSEKSRLDRLLESGKRFHNIGFVLAGILIALSSLGSFDKFAAPFGEIVFPKLEASIGLFFLCIASLVVTDRYFLLALPWMKIDDRRPPFDWVVMTLRPERNLVSGFIFDLPLFIASIGLSTILATVPSATSVATYALLAFTGFSLTYLPRTIYYWSHLIGIREDHRGGAVTFSIYLLYLYRMLRQILYSIYIFWPMIIVIPQWKNSQFSTTLRAITLLFAAAYAIRMLCTSKFIYQRIDKYGLKLGFSVTSQHYH